MASTGYVYPSQRTYSASGSAVGSTASNPTGTSASGSYYSGGTGSNISLSSGGTGYASGSGSSATITPTTNISLASGGVGYATGSGSSSSITPVSTPVETHLPTVQFGYNEQGNVTSMDVPYGYNYQPVDSTHYQLQPVGGWQPNISLMGGGVGYASQSTSPQVTMVAPNMQFSNGMYGFAKGGEQTVLATSFTNPTATLDTGNPVIGINGFQPTFSIGHPKGGASLEDLQSSLQTYVFYNPAWTHPDKIFTVGGAEAAKNPVEFGMGVLTLTSLGTGLMGGGSSAIIEGTWEGAAKNAGTISITESYVQKWQSPKSTSFEADVGAGRINVPRGTGTSIKTSWVTTDPVSRLEPAGKGAFNVGNDEFGWAPERTPGGQPLPRSSTVQPIDAFKPLFEPGVKGYEGWASERTPGGQPLPRMNELYDISNRVDNLNLRMQDIRTDIKLIDSKMGEITDGRVPIEFRKGSSLPAMVDEPGFAPERVVNSPLPRVVEGASKPLFEGGKTIVGSSTGAKPLFGNTNVEYNGAFGRLINNLNTGRLVPATENAGNLFEGNVRYEPTVKLANRVPSGFGWTDYGESVAQVNMYSRGLGSVSKISSLPNEAGILRPVPGDTSRFFSSGYDPYEMSLKYRIAEMRMQPDISKPTGINFRSPFGKGEFPLGGGTPLTPPEPPSGGISGFKGGGGGGSPGGGGGGSGATSVDFESVPMSAGKGTVQLGKMMKVSAPPSEASPTQGRGLSTQALTRTLSITKPPASIPEPPLTSFKPLSLSVSATQFARAFKPAQSQISIQQTRTVMRPQQQVTQQQQRMQTQQIQMPQLQTQGFSLQTQVQMPQLQAQTKQVQQVQVQQQNLAQTTQQIQRQMTGTQQLTQIGTIQNQITKIDNPFREIKPPSKQEIPLGGFMPMNLPNFGGGGIFGGGMSRPSKRKYVPSLLGIALGKTVRKAPSLLTGGEIRFPVIGGFGARRSKRRKR